jgi:hypothetical protein
VRSSRPLGRDLIGHCNRRWRSPVAVCKKQPASRQGEEGVAAGPISGLGGDLTTTLRMKLKFSDLFAVIE